MGRRQEVDLYFAFPLAMRNERATVCRMSRFLASLILCQCLLGVADVFGKDPTETDLGQRVLTPGIEKNLSSKNLKKISGISDKRTKVYNVDKKVASMDGKRSMIRVTETKNKDFVQFRNKKYRVIPKNLVSLSGKEAKIPKLEKDEFKNLLQKYQKGMTRPVVRTKAEGYTEEASESEINKISNPSEKLEEQGISVKKAGEAAEGEE